MRIRSLVIFLLPALAALLFTASVWTGRDIPAGPLPQPAVPGMEMPPVPLGLPDSRPAENAPPENPEPPAVESVPSSAVVDSVTEDTSQAWDRTESTRPEKDVDPAEESASPAAPRGLPVPIAIPGNLEIQLEVTGGSLNQLLRGNGGLWKTEGGVYKRFGSNNASPSCEELDKYVIDGQFIEFKNLKSQKGPFLLPAELTRRILEAVQEKLEKDKAYSKAVVRLTIGGTVTAVVLETAGR